MKRMILCFLTLCMLLTVLAPAARAAEPETTDASTEVAEEPEATEATEVPTQAPTEAPTEAPENPNACGENMTWSFADGVLTITGDGKMDDFEENAAPWQAHKDEIEEVVIEGNVTYIGAYAFKDYDALLAVDFGDALYEIGREAFRSCDGLEVLFMPATFKIFGERSLQSCKNLSEIHCTGKPLTFKDNSVWDTWATIYYPAERPWSVSYIEELEKAFKGRIQFLASDGTDHYVPTEPPTEPEETVPETTAPEPTVPEMHSPETEPPAEEPPLIIMPRPTTDGDPDETEPPTERPTEPATAPDAQDSGRSAWILVVIVLAALLAGLALGFAVFGRKKGRYAR